MIVATRFARCRRRTKPDVGLDVDLYLYSICYCMQSSPAAASRAAALRHNRDVPTGRFVNRYDTKHRMIEHTQQKSENSTH